MFNAELLWNISKWWIYLEFLEYIIIKSIYLQYILYGGYI